MDIAPQSSGVQNGVTVRGILTILLILVCGTLISAFVYGKYEIYFKSLLNSQTNKEATLSGKIYLSLVSEKGDPAHMGIYAFDVVTKNLESYLPANQIKEEEYMAPSFSPDNTSVAVYGMADNARNIYRFTSNRPGEDMSVVASIDESLEGIRHFRAPQWSPDGAKIVFMGNSTLTTERLFNPSSWKIFITTVADGIRVPIADGAYPHFVSDNTLVALKSDGLYRYTIIPGSPRVLEERIWDVRNGTAGTHMQFTVSSDKKKIAWTVPQENKILIIAVDSWDPFSGVIEQTVPIKAFWPVFSSDGAFLAAEEVDSNDLNQKLVVYRLSDLSEVVSYDLTRFVQTRLYVTDWR